MLPQFSSLPQHCCQFPGGVLAIKSPSLRLAAVGEPRAKACPPTRARPRGSEAREEHCLVNAPFFANLISFQMQDIKVPGTLDLCRGKATAANQSKGDLMAKKFPGDLIAVLGQRKIGGAK